MIYRLQLTFTLNLRKREEIAKAISGVEMVNSNRLTFEELNDYGKIIHNTWAEKDDLSQLWNVLQPVRNALDHAGHQEGAMSVENILKKVDKISLLLDKTATTWKII